MRKGEITLGQERAGRNKEDPKGGRRIVVLKGKSTGRRVVEFPKLTN